MDVEGYVFKRVTHFKYLGHLMTQDNDLKMEVSARIQKGNKSFLVFVAYSAFILHYITRIVFNIYILYIISSIILRSVGTVHRLLLCKITM
jgi:hypothetical protein